MTRARAERERLATEAYPVEREQDRAPEEVFGERFKRIAINLQALCGKDELLEIARDACGWPEEINARLPKCYLRSTERERKFKLVDFSEQELRTTTLSLEWLGIDNHDQTWFVWVYPHAEASKAFTDARKEVETLASICKGRQLDMAIEEADRRRISSNVLKSLGKKTGSWARVAAAPRNSLRPKLQPNDNVDSELERIKDSLASMERICGVGGYLYFGRGGVLKGAFAASEVILRATDSTTTAAPQEQPLQLVYGECCKIGTDDDTWHLLKQLELLKIRPHEARVAMAPWLELNMNTNLASR